MKTSRPLSDSQRSRLKEIAKVARKVARQEAIARASREHLYDMVISARKTGVTQRDLAKAAAMSQPRVNAIVKGH